MDAGPLRLVPGNSRRRHRHRLLQQRGSQDVVDKVMAVREEIVKGTKQVFGGPLADRDGKERVAAGKVLGDGGSVEDGLVREGCRHPTLGGSAGRRIDAVAPIPRNSC